MGVECMKAARAECIASESTASIERNIMTANKHVKAHTAKSQPTEFTCHAPDAKQVFVAGTFNEWKPDAMPLARDEAGHWRGSLNLASGRHEFKFVVDGEWCCEPGCEGGYHGCPKCCANEFGTMNRVLEVS